MKGIRKYDLNDERDLTKLNKLLNSAGIHLERNLFDPYIWIDIDRFETFSKRRAGRRTIISRALRYKVFTLRTDRKSIAEISSASGISTATVRKILKDYEAPSSTGQQSLDL